MFSVVPLKGQTPQIGLICELERMILPKITYKAARPLYVPCKGVHGWGSRHLGNIGNTDSILQAK